MGACQSVNNIKDRDERLKTGLKRSLEIVYVSYAFISLSSACCWVVIYASPYVQFNILILVAIVFSLLFGYLAILLAITGNIMLHRVVLNIINNELNSIENLKDHLQHVRNILVSSSIFACGAAIFIFCTVLVVSDFAFVFTIIGVFLISIQANLTIISSIHCGEIRSALLFEHAGADCCGPPLCVPTLCCWRGCNLCDCGLKNSCSGKQSKDIEAGEVTRSKSTNILIETESTSIKDFTREAPMNQDEEHESFVHETKSTDLPIIGELDIPTAAIIASD